MKTGSSVKQANLKSERNAPLAMSGEEFRVLGHQMVDQIAAFLDGIRERPVTVASSPIALRQLLGSDELPVNGAKADELFTETSRLLFENSLLNGHPRFWGYITSSAAPIGALADLLASAVNPNVGAAVLSPVATEIEAQTVRWLADLIGYPRDCGGLLVSGGNMANFVAFLAATKAKASWDIKNDGTAAAERRLVAYVSTETHIWIDKAAELFGLGKSSIRQVPVDADQKMLVPALISAIETDISNGLQPFMVVAAAGTVGTGAVDPLPAIKKVCERYGLWLHVDGAYGAPAAMLPDASEDLRGLNLADSVALDPHKWLYSPIEAGCTLVRDKRYLIDAFSHRPAYYNFNGDGENDPINFHEYRLQNSRGFRALKVWLAIKHVGREGYEKMIGDDIRLATELFQFVEAEPMLETGSHNLSITTFRFVPKDLDSGTAEGSEYLNKLNTEILNRIQKGGEVFVSNALIDGRYFLRACIVNFRTTTSDLEALVEIVVRIGKEVDAELRSATIAV
ncbi:MAG TPA: aspartate aminotransferase family protein [Blastocatellia bacterium]|nr:aspartate aminotransferase family protein [Blastocatellia bacterium]